MIIAHYSTRQIAAYLNRSVRWVQLAAKKNHLGELDESGRLQFSQMDADRFLALCNPRERRGRKRIRRMPESAVPSVLPAVSEPDHSALPPTPPHI